MCVIIAKPIGIEVPKATYLREAWDTNPDGAGLLYKKEGDKKFTIKKGFMEFKDLLRFLEITNFKKNDFVAYHFRITTSGGTSPENCHPFPITKKNASLKQLEITTKKALMHNGILFHTSGDYSDTQVFTKYLALRKLTDFSNKKMIKEIGVLAKTNRLLLVDGDTIEFVGNWLSQENGLLLSNDNFLYSFNYDYSINSKLIDDDLLSIASEKAYYRHIVTEFVEDNLIDIDDMYIEYFLDNDITYCSLSSSEVEKDFEDFLFTTLGIDLFAEDLTFSEGVNYA